MKNKKQNTALKGLYTEAFYMKGRELYHFKLCEAEEAYNETNALQRTVGSC